jgi:HlyD family secretion protein
VGLDTTARSGAGGLARLGVLATALAGCVLLAGCGSSAPATPRTVPVTRGSVSTSVSAVGSVSSGQVNVGFPQGGQLTSVRVRVGDRVEQGQILATVDDYAARQALRQAQAQLDGQEANLEQAEDSTSVGGARAALEQAQRILDATERVARDGAGAAGAAGGAGSAGTAAASTGGGAPGAAGAAGAGGGSSAAGDLQVEQARQGVVQAQTNLDAAEAQRPHTLDAAEAAVDGARAGVNTARQNLANTTLRAPSDGTVTALNGVVGEFVGASSGTTAQAPGGGAAIPGAPAASAATGAAGAAGAAGGASPTRPGGAQFVVLDDASALQVVVPFQEEDAAAIAVGQHVDVSVDAIPDATLGGSVQAVAPSGAAISNVVNYYVTVALTAPDPRLREGQTARATVVTGQVDSALTVPNSSVRRQGTSSSVVVVGPDGRQQATRFTPGLVGTDRTQVLGGLQENQQILTTGGRSR